MTQLTDLRVFNEARRNIREIAKLCDQTRTFGDLKDQAKRAAVSVASNIAEGHGGGTVPQTLRFFSIARASNHELYAQVLIIKDLNQAHDTNVLLENINYVGRMLTRFIQNLVQEQ